MKLKIVIVGLSITSSWGNGHATTYRALAKALSNRGHSVSFLERDVAWYREHRDLANADYCSIRLYGSLPELARGHAEIIRDADLVILGSYVPDGIAIGDWITAGATGVTAFYDIDTPVTLAGLETNKISYLSPGLIPRFDLYLSFSGGPALGIVQDLYGSPLVGHCIAAQMWSIDLRRLHRSGRSDISGPTAKIDSQHLKSCCLHLRTPFATISFVVAGPKYPDSLEWPANVTYIPHLSPNEHASFYGSQRYALNVTRSDMKALGFSPSVRLFEAAACGIPVISDAWPGMETVFAPGKEILIATEPRDVIQILTDMPEERRLGIAAAARARFLKEHTPDHRARQLEAYYQEALARRRVPNSTRQAVQLEEVK